MDQLIRDACAGLPNVSVIAGQPLVPHLPEFYSDRRLHPNDLGFGIYAQNLQRAIATTPPMTGCGCARLVGKDG